MRLGGIHLRRLRGLGLGRLRLGPRLRLRLRMRLGLRLGLGLRMRLGLRLRMRLLTGLAGVSGLVVLARQAGLPIVGKRFNLKIFLFLDELLNTAAHIGQLSDTVA